MRIQPELAGAVRFQQGNILGAEFPPGPGRRYGIIFCRNLLIYLTQDARQRVLERLDSMLEPGGLLFSGHTEVLLLQQFGYALLPERGCFASRKPAAQEPAAEPARAQARRHVSRPAEKKRKQPPARPRIFAEEKSAGAGDARPELLEEIRELADRGELEKAASQCAAFIESSGSLHAKAHCLMGEISQARNQAEAAERYFLRAVYLDPACYDALVHLSLLYEHKGSPEKALRFRERARRLQGCGL
jgi:chemotaxis protein methyltransferase WspC